MVVVELQYSGRASPSSCGGGEVLGRGGATPWMWCCGSALAPLFIGEGGSGASPSRWDLEGAAAKGGGGLPPKQGRRPPLGFPPTLGAWSLGVVVPSLQGAGSLPSTAHEALLERWIPGTPLVASVQYRYAPEYFR